MHHKYCILDLSRFAASLIVFLTHFEIPFQTVILRGTFATTAVSWFFIVSGFVLSNRYRQLSNSDEVKTFYLRRVIRIYPVYFASLLAAFTLVIIGYNEFGEEFFSTLRRPSLFYAGLPLEKDTTFWLEAVTRHLFFAQSYFAPDTLKLLFNGPLWSIVVEMAFYLFFPLLLIAVAKVNSLGKIILFSIFLYIAQLGLIQIFLPNFPTYDVMNLNGPVYTNPLVRVVEFILGMLLFKIHIHTFQMDIFKKYGAALLLLSVGLYCFSVIYSENNYPYEYSSFFISIPAVVLLVLCMVNLHWSPQNWVLRVAAYLGGVSYVLYCFHWTLMELLLVSGWISNEWPAELQAIIVISAVCLASSVIYTFYDEPVRKKIHKLMAKNS